MNRTIAALVLTILGLCSHVAAQDSAVQTSKVQTKVPVSYGLVVDNSGSFRMLLDRVITVVSEIIENNQADDEAFLVTFVSEDKIVVRQEFTNSKSELLGAAENMYVEGGKTALLDAVKTSADYLATNSRQEGERGRVLVVVTDGDELQSFFNTEQVLKALKDSKIRVYVIGMSDTKVVTKYVDRLVKETGGKLFTPNIFRKPELSAVARDVSLAMRTK